MNKEATLLQHVEKQLAGHTGLLVGFSGGLDSTVLLHLLTRIRDSRHSVFHLRAIHINHGLSPAAGAWTGHCQYQCKQWQVPLTIVPVQIDARDYGIEGAARAARYQVFAQHLAAEELLLTAQHQDDQCETFLLALKRGSGPAGLSSMARLTTLTQNQLQRPCQLLRPLLAYSRTDLARYAQQHQLCYVEDESNQDARFDRNFLRLRILPLLQQRWPHFAQATARSASLCAEQEQLLDELLAPTLDQLQHSDGSLSTEGLLRFSEVKRNALLRRWLSGQGVTMPARDQLQRLWKEVVLARVDATPHLQCGQYQLHRFRQRLYLLTSRIDITEQVLLWPVTRNLAIEHPNYLAIENAVIKKRGAEDLVLPANLGTLKLLATGGQQVRTPTADEIVSVRFGLQGEVKIIGRHRSRQSKKLWQELNVPPWERNRIPLLYFNEQLIAAIGTFITQEGQIKAGEQGWHLHWVRN
ncbi:tRNA lysidine(34) synthetase TilS [Candidatus Fukatsuia endosymbiont of Tuberolachnus salignus]|uniref:tRNA lysidine(34) synthetase TilS n=1 Tax=Candidatus Fukatsuia endosymbiont of Tuberolachnus salignus TaxID=3077957 RepID=UPI00313DB06A